MARRLPAALQKLRVADQVVQRALDGLADGVNGILSTLTGAFKIGDSAIEAQDPLIVPGLTVNGNETVTGNETVSGTLTVTGALAAKAGAAVTGTSTITGNQTVSGTLGVTGATTLSGGLNTPSGIRFSVGPATYYGTSGVGGGLRQVVYNVSTGTFDNMAWTWVAPYAGSLMAINGYYSTAIPAGSAARVDVAKNGATFVVGNTYNPGTTAFVQSFTRGAQRFAAGDVFTFGLTLASAYTQSCLVYLTVELDT